MAFFFNDVFFLYIFWSTALRNCSSKPLINLVSKWSSQTVVSFVMGKFSFLLTYLFKLPCTLGPFPQTDTLGPFPQTELWTVLSVAMSFFSWRPHVYAHTYLSPHDCAQTRLCPHAFVPRHVCVQTSLCPHTFVPTHCAHTRLCPDTFVPTLLCPDTYLVPWHAIIK